jgi:formylglycine-generating enzyme required for sulfatase activity
MATQVFVSYRREDSLHQAGRLYDRLIAQFGADHVFMDVDSDVFGVDFREVLTQRVVDCDVFLAVIGDSWLSIAGRAGSRRLDDSRDFVRIEIETALSRQIPVIPVLVGNSPVPAPEELPESLRGLSFRHGLHVRPNPDFNKDVDRLVRGIESAVARQRERSAPPGQGTETSPDQKPAGPSASVVAHALPLGIRPEVRGGPKQITKPRGTQLALIPAGTCLMGSPGSDREADDDEKPQHRIRISREFYLGVHAVTQGLYRAITKDNPSHFQGSADLPVENVSWLDAVNFCNALSSVKGFPWYYQIDGQQVEIPDRDGQGYRLPTEAEWEYACRANSVGLYSFGYRFEELGDHAWFDTNSGGQTHRVGEKRPNAFGLFDMHGNVWEWCSDGYDPFYYVRSSGLDPANSFQGTTCRVVRGGSWSNDPWFCRLAYRSGCSPGYWSSNLGFRVARNRSREG